MLLKKLNNLTKKLFYYLAIQVKLMKERIFIILKTQRKLKETFLNFELFDNLCNKNLVY